MFLNFVNSDCRGINTIDAVFALTENAKAKDINLQLDFIKSMATGAKISREKIQVILTRTFERSLY